MQIKQDRETIPWTYPDMLQYFDTKLFVAPTAVNEHIDNLL